MQQTFTFQDTTATRKVFSLTKRVRAVAGGTSASKTISILVWLINYCQVPQQKQKLCSVVSEAYPHLEKGAMLDFENIMKDRGYWVDSRWHGTKHTYTFETGNKIEFMSVDTYGKAHGPRRDVLFVNECNNLDYKIVDQLISRTRETTWLDWNPSQEFWFYTEMLNVRKNLDFITLTYLDNEALDKDMVEEIESHKHNKRWWQVYGLGQLGDVEGKIYTDWVEIEDIPHEARLVRRGLDFGYTNDPSALIDIYYYNGSYILNERIYRKGLSNKQLADTILNLEQPQTLIIADSAEPKSIDELRSYGLNVIPTTKGPGSVNQGIQYVQDQRMSYTARSLNLKKEYRNYMWKIDPLTDKVLNVPEDVWNHALDAVRYAIQSLVKHSLQEAAVVNIPPPYEKQKAFYTDEDGQVIGLHVNIAKALNESNEDWQ